MQQQQQQQQQQQLGMLPSLTDIVPGAPHQGAIATGFPTNALPVFPDAIVAPQHSASSVVWQKVSFVKLMIHTEKFG